MESAGQGYTPPEVQDYGDLVAMTEASSAMSQVGVSGRQEPSFPT